MKKIKRLFKTLFIIVFFACFVYILTSCDAIEGNVVVTFDFNGGLYRGSKEREIKTHRGRLYIPDIPNPVKENHSLEYYKDKNSAIYYVEDLTKTKFKKKTTLTASWEEVTYDISALKVIYGAADSIKLNEFENDDTMGRFLNAKKGAKEIIDTNDITNSNIITLCNLLNELLSELTRISTATSDDAVFENTKQIITNYTTNLLKDENYNDKIFKEDDVLLLFSQKSLSEGFKLTWTISDNSIINQESSTLKIVSDNDAKEITLIGLLEYNNGEKKLKTTIDGFKISVLPKLVGEDLLNHYVTLVTEDTNQKITAKEYIPNDKVSLFTDKENRIDIKWYDNNNALLENNAITFEEHSEEQVTITIKAVLSVDTYLKELTFNFTVFKTPPTPEELLNAAIQRINDSMDSYLDEVYDDNDSISLLLSNNLPSTVIVTWSKEDENVTISKDGLVTFIVNNEARIVTLKATISVKELPDHTLTFNINVLGHQDKLNEIITRVKQDMTSKVSKSYITGDFMNVLTSSGLQNNDATITWQTENTENANINNTTGKITFSSNSTTTIILKAKVTYKTLTPVEVTFNIKIIGNLEILSDAVSRIVTDMTPKINKTYGNNSTLQVLKSSDLTGGVTVTWSTQDTDPNTNVNNNSGIVTFLSTDVERYVTLVALIKSGTNEQTKTFIITISKIMGLDGDVPQFDRPSTAPSGFIHELDIGNHYDSLDPNATGVTLFNELSVITNSGFQGRSYSGMSNLMKYTDMSPYQSGKVWGIYTSTNINGNWDGGSSFNKEHVWPKSKIGANTNTGQPGSDYHNLRACNPSVNSSRGNDLFVSGSGTYGKRSGGWYPGDEHVGDVARILLYMVLKWTNYNLKLSTTDGNYQFGNLKLLLAWHNQDPVDVFEVNRQEQIVKYQGNRNPFIDHPSLFEKVWTYLMQKANLTLSASERSEIILSNHSDRITLFKVVIRNEELNF